MPPPSFVNAQIETLNTTVGKSVVRWDAIEMAILESGADGQATFEHPDAPCLQLSMTAIILAPGKPMIIKHYQGDAYFEFLIELYDNPFQDFRGTEGIYRRRRLNELPTGIIQSATARLSRLDNGDGELAEVLLKIGDNEVLLVAGEIEETWTSQLSWRWLEESTLVFTRPEDADDLPWVPQRQFIERHTQRS